MIKLDMYAGGIYSGKTQQIMERALTDAMETGKGVLFITEDRLIDRMGAFFGLKGVSMESLPEIKQSHDRPKDMTDSTCGQIRSFLADEAILVIDHPSASDDEIRTFLKRFEDLLTRVYLTVGQQAFDFEVDNPRFPAPYPNNYDVLKFVCYRTNVDGEDHYSVKEVA